MAEIIDEEEDALVKEEFTATWNTLIMRIIALVER